MGEGTSVFLVEEWERWERRVGEGERGGRGRGYFGLSFSIRNADPEPGSEIWNTNFS